MRDLHVIVSNKVATYLTRDGNIVCGNSDYQIVFAFDAEWDSYSIKTARFVYHKDGQTKFKDMVFSGNTAAVPPLSGIQEVYVGVYAGNLCTTTPARILCEKSILCDTGSNEAPSEDVYQQIIELINAGVVSTSTVVPNFANSIDECTDTSKPYVLPDGMIYAYMYAEVAEGGYTNCVKKTDSLFECPKRINASFQVVSSSSSNAFVSNYIPAQAQQVLRMKGIDNGDFRILCYKEDGTYVFGFEMASGSSTKQILDRTTIDENGVWTYTLGHSGNGADHDFDNRGIAQIRIGGTAVNGIDNIIVTVDEEIVEHEIVKEYRWASTGHAFVPADYEGWLIALEAEDLKIHKEILNAKEEASEAIADLQEQIDSGAASAKSGARWFALGDSITEGYASSFNADGSYKQYIAAVGKRWVDIVAKRNGYQLTNYGAGGTGYYYSAYNAKAQVENIDFTECDFVTLAYGCNDWKYDGSVIGTEADIPQTVVSNYNGHNSIRLADGTASNVVVYKNGVLLTVNTDYTISGGYLVLKSDTVHNDRFDLYSATESMVANMSYVIKKILWQNPLCKIFVITPINCKALGTYGSNWGINYAGTGGCGKPLQYVYEMQKAVCEQYGIELIDMTHNSVVNRENLRDVLADGIHPTEACHEQMARELARKIRFV